MNDFVLLDAMPLAASVLAAFVCALIGNFLVLRREAMLGDAISHAVLPGLIVAFLLLESAGSLAVLLGAAASGLACVGLIELLKRNTKLESGASIGVVFTVLFAAGVFLVERYARNSHIDADCVLFGDVQLLAPWNTQLPLPRQIWMLLIALAGTVALIVLLFKELRLVCFDRTFAGSIGFRAGVLDLLLMIAVAFAVVASFEAVGAILVVAMLVCPAACARLLTDRLGSQLFVSAAIAAGTSIASYFIATQGLVWLSDDPSMQVAVSGTMATLAGLLVGVCILAAPRHGAIARALAKRDLLMRIMEEDVLGALYRLEESGGLPGGRGAALSPAMLAPALAETRRDRRRLRRAIERLQTGDLLESVGSPGVQLSAKGRERARGLIRTHRLWESYLVGVLGLRADHVHRTAEDLEHLTSAELASALEDRIHRQGGSTLIDPHDRPIPRQDGE
jgi:manganese/zinc/iron transport system permease protein